MRLLEREAAISATADDFDAMRLEVARSLDADEAPVRFAVTGSERGVYECAVGVVSGGRGPSPSDLFEFRRRGYESQAGFNVVFVAPTGIGLR